MNDVSADELVTLRRDWTILLGDQGRDDLAVALLARLDRELDGAEEALRKSDTQEARARYIGRLVRDVLLMQHLHRRERVVEGPYWCELRERLGEAPPPPEPQRADEEADGATEANHADDADPYFAWSLSSEAREAAQPARAALIDRAIEAFDAIALSPRDAGNDEGPMAEIASLMDERQVRRALAVTDRMAGAEWGESLSYAKMRLTARVAALGHLDEAESMLPLIADGQVRARGLGQVRARRVLQQGEWRPAPIDSHLADGRCFHQFLVGLSDVLCEPDITPPEQLVRDCMARVRSEPDLSQRTPQLLAMSGWFSTGPAEHWFEVICGCPTDWLQVDLLFQLAEAISSSAFRATVARAAIERMLALPEQISGLWLDEIYALRAALPPREVCGLFATVMSRTARSRAWLLQDFHYAYDVVELLRWLGGDDALRSTLGGLDAVKDLLGRAPTL